MFGPYTNLVLLTAVLVLPLLVLKPLAPVIGAWAKDGRRLGRVGLSLMLCLTGSAHFFATERMAMMFPDWVPATTAIVYVTGVLEFVLAAALWLFRYTRIVGLLIAVMLVAFLPANIYAAVNSLPFGGNVLGPHYLWLRIPYQIFLVFWSLWATGWIGRR